MVLASRDGLVRSGDGSSSSSMTGADDDDGISFWVFVPVVGALTAQFVTLWYTHPLTLRSVRQSFLNAPPLPPAASATGGVVYRAHPGRVLCAVSLESYVSAIPGLLGTYAAGACLAKVLPIDEEPNDYMTTGMWDPLESQPSSGHEWPELTSKVLSVIIGTAFARPFILAVNRINAQPLSRQYKYTGSLQAIKLIYREEGLSPFVRGFWPSYVQCLLQTLAEREIQNHKHRCMALLTRFITTRNKHVLIALHAFATCLDSVLSSMALIAALRPLIVVARHLDIQGSGLERALNVPVLTNWMQATKYLWKNGGVSAFYAGLTTELLQCIPLVIVAGLTDAICAYNKCYPIKTYHDL